MELTLKPKPNVITYDDIVTSNYCVYLDEFVTKKVDEQESE